MHQPQLPQRRLKLKLSPAKGKEVRVREEMWCLWLAQKQGDRSHSYHMPNTLPQLQNKMAGPRAQDRLPMSKLARAAASSKQHDRAAGRCSPAQPGPKKGQELVSSDTDF